MSMPKRQRIRTSAPMPSSATRYPNIGVAAATHPTRDYLFNPPSAVFEGR
jgi:hypothetical protein